MNDAKPELNSESYTPKPGDVIKPTSMTNAVPTEPKIFVPVSPKNDQELLTSQPIISLEKPETVSNPVATLPVVPSENNAKEIKPKFKIPEIPTKVKKILKTFFVVLTLFIVLGGVLAYVLPVLMPKPEEKPPEQIILPPVVREEPREDKTSLRYLDNKLREIKPSLEELNNDSVFLFKLNLSDSDF